MADIASTDQPTFVITGPTSGIGRATALELAGHGLVILVGRDIGKLRTLEKEITSKGNKATCVECNLSDMTSVANAAQAIRSLELPISGLINNAGVMAMGSARTRDGWDLTFATNHLGPFLLTERLIPQLPNGSDIVFICSGVEDPERKPAKMAGFRGGRYISAKASVSGQWKPGGSKMAGADAYATSKQCNLATAMVLARENPHLRINAVEPGFSPATGLGRDANLFLRLLGRYVAGPLAPYIKYWSTPKLAARVIVDVLLNKADATAMYFDERGEPMMGSSLVREREFQERVVAETRQLLSVPISR